jgi:glutathione synthase
MRSLFLLNHLSDLKPRMTSMMLIEAALRRAQAVWVCGIEDLSLAEDGQVTVRARPCPAPAARGDEAGRQAWLGRLAAADVERLAASTFDRLLIRTNPARDDMRAALHRSALELCWLAADRGLVVINHPQGLARAAGKLFLARLPASDRPRMQVSADAAALRRFVEEAPGPSVLKPLAGTRGSGVFRVQPGDPNLNAIIETLTARGPALAQDWAPGAEAGDLRAILLDGRPLRVQGHWAAIRRRPAAGDFRSNLHAGGQAEPAEPSAAQQALLDRLGPLLVAEGLSLVGVDLIGAQVIELNVHATGGLFDAERFGGVDFCDPILASFEAQRSAGVSGKSEGKQA